MQYISYIPTALLIINIVLFIISFIDLKERKKNPIINKIITHITFIYLLLYTLSLYTLTNLLDNKDHSYIFYVTGVILFCYGLFSSFISTIISTKFINLACCIVFLIGSISFLIHSIIKYKITSIYNISSILYIFGSILFILAEIYKIKYTINIGWFLFILGRLVIMIPDYLNNTSYYHHFK